MHQNWDVVKEKAMDLGIWIMDLYEKYKILFAIFLPIIAIGIELVKNWDVIKAAAILL